MICLTSLGVLPHIKTVTLIDRVTIDCLLDNGTVIRYCLVVHPGTFTCGLDVIINESLLGSRVFQTNCGEITAVEKELWRDLYYRGSKAASAKSDLFDKFIASRFE